MVHHVLLGHVLQHAGLLDDVAFFVALFTQVVRAQVLVDLGELQQRGQQVPRAFIELLPLRQHFDCVCPGAVHGRTIGELTLTCELVLERLLHVLWEHGQRHDAIEFDLAVVPLLLRGGASNGVHLDLALLLTGLVLVGCAVRCNATLERFAVHVLAVLHHNGHERVAELVAVDLLELRRDAIILEPSVADAVLHRATEQPRAHVEVAGVLELDVLGDVLAERLEAVREFQQLRLLRGLLIERNVAVHMQAGVHCEHVEDQTFHAQQHHVPHAALLEQGDLAVERLAGIVDVAAFADEVLIEQQILVDL